MKTSVSKPYKKKIKSLGALLAAAAGAAGALTPVAAHAADKYWDTSAGASNGVGGTGTFGTTFSTSSAGSASLTTAASGDALFFQGTSGVVSLGADQPGSGSFANATFAITGYTLTPSSGTARAFNSIITLGSSVNLNLNDSTATTNRTLNLGGNVTGSTGSSLTVLGNQTSGASSRVNLNVSGMTIDVPIFINLGANGAGGMVATATNTVLTANATITNNSAGLTIVGATSGNSIVVNGVISGGQGLRIAAGDNGGAGTVTINAAGNYTGVTQLNAANSGIVKEGVDNAFTSTTALTMGFSSGNGGILDLNGHNQEVASIANGVGNGTIRNDAGGGTVSTFTISGNASTTFGLIIIDHSTGNGTVAITRSGNGTTTLAANNANQNTYSGTTTVSGTSTLKAGAINSFGFNSVHTIGSGATLDLSGFSNSVALLAGNGTVDGSSGAPILTLAGTTGTQTFGGLIKNTSGTLGLVKSGAGTQIFTSANTYSGPTTISSGTFLANNGNGSATGSGDVTVSGATFGGNGAVSGAVALKANGAISAGSAAGLVGTLGTGGETWSNTSSLSFDVNNATGSAGSGYDTLNVNGVLDLSSLSTGGFTINIFGRTAGGSTGAVTNFSNTSAYTWVLASASSISGFSAANFTISATPANFTTVNSIGSGNFSVVMDGGNLELVFTPGSYTSKNLVWTNASNDGLWNSASVNWTQPPPAAFTATDNVTFNDTAPGTVTIDAAGVAPGSVTVNSSGNYTLQGGSINGSGSLTKTGGGTLVLLPTGSNGYTGGTIINGGTVAISTDGALGGAIGSIAFNGGTLRTDAAITSSRVITVGASGGTIDTHGFDSVLTPASAIALTGNFTKAGSGDLAIRTNGFNGAGNVNVIGGQLTLGDTTSSASAPVNFLGAGSNHLYVSNGGLRIAAGTTGTLASAGNTFAGNSSVTLYQTAGTAAAMTYTLGGATGVSGQLEILADGNVVTGSNSNSRLVLGATTLSGDTTYKMHSAGAPGALNASNLTIGAINDNGFTTTWLSDGSATQLPGNGVFLNTVTTQSTGNWVLGKSDGTGGVLISLGVAASQAQGAMTTGNIVVNPYSQLQFFQGTTASFGSASQTITLHGNGVILADGSAGVAGALLYNPSSPNTASVTYIGNLAIGSDGASVVINGNGGNNKLTVTGNTNFAGTFNKQGSGEFIVGGTATGTGGTTINSGKVTANAGAGLGTGDLVFAQTGTSSTRIDLKNAAQTVSSLSTVWNAPAQGSATTITQRLDLTGTLLTINQAGNTTFGHYTSAPSNVTGSGVITGTGSLVKAGAGTLALSDVNTFTGNVTVNEGTLRLDATGSILGTNILVDGSGAVLQLDNSADSDAIGDTKNFALANGGTAFLNFVGIEHVGSLTLDGTTYTDGLFTSANNSSYFGGSGAIAVPEPTSAGLIAMAGVGMLARRRRRVRKA